METWTDDDGVTHDMSGIMAGCFINVQSKRGPCKNDDPPRTVTCLDCAAGDVWQKLFNNMIEHGIGLDQEKLEDARALWVMERIPLGTGR